MGRTAKKEKHQYGQGSIWFDTRHQKWYARVRAGKTVNGKANYITVCADTQSKCKKRLDEAKKKKAFFYFIDPETVTVGEMIEGIANQKYESKKIEKATRDSELKNIHNYDFLVDIRVKDVTEEDLQLFFESKLDRSNSVLQNHYHYLEKVFNIALALNIIKDSPLRKLPKPCTRNTPVEIRPLTVDEQRDLTRLLLKHRDEYKYWNIFLISLYTGMSLGEITALNANDVDLENGYVRVTKKLVNANGKVELSYELKPKQKRNVPYQHYHKTGVCDVA